MWFKDLISNGFPVLSFIFPRTNSKPQNKKESNLTEVLLLSLQTRYQKTNQKAKMEHKIQMKGRVPKRWNSLSLFGTDRKFRHEKKGRGQWLFIEAMTLLHVSHVSLSCNVSVLDESDTLLTRTTNLITFLFVSYHLFFLYSVFSKMVSNHSRNITLYYHQPQVRTQMLFYFWGKS